MVFFKFYLKVGVPGFLIRYLTTATVWERLDKITLVGTHWGRGCFGVLALPEQKLAPFKKIVWCVGECPLTSYKKKKPGTQALSRPDVQVARLWQYRKSVISIVRVFGLPMNRTDDNIYSQHLFVDVLFRVCETIFIASFKLVVDVPFECVRLSSDRHSFRSQLKFKKKS